MRILVTGGAGFIGSNLVDALIEKGHTVAVADNLSTGNIAHINPNAKFYKLDILTPDLKTAFDDFKPEAVYHEAAQIDVQKSVKEPGFDANINIIGSINVLENCVAAGVKKLIYASSAAVYGPPEYLGIDENHPVNPISYYGISKHTPEHYIKTYSVLFGLNYTILRYANVYGIRQDPKGEGGVVSIFVDKMLKAQDAYIFGDGKQTRDFVYVKDIVGANLAALNAGDGEIINIGTGVTTDVNELFAALKEISGVNKEPIYQPARKGDILHSYFNVNKAAQVLNWKAQYSLKKGLSETFNYYKEKML